MGRPVDLSALATAALLSGLLVVCSSVPSRSEEPFPSPVTLALSADLRITTTETDLRMIAAMIQSKSGVPIVVDRRVNPNLSERTEGDAADAITLAPTVVGAIEQLADFAKTGWATDGAVVFIGPEPNVAILASSLARLRHQLHNRPNAAPPGWSKPQRLQWPLLTQPTEVLTEISDSWPAPLSPVTLPYDLWTEADVGEVDLVAALGIVGGGFDMVPQVTTVAENIARSPGFQLTHFESTETVPTFVRSYPGQRLTSQQRQLIGGKLRKRGEQWELEGTAQQHHRLEMAIVANQQQRPAATTSSQTTTYSLRLDNTADKAMELLCRTAQLRLVVAESAREKLGQRVQLDAKDKTLAEIIRMVAKEAEVEIEIDAEVVTVR